MEAVIVIWKFQYNNNPVMIRFMIQKHYELYHFPRVSSLEIEGEKKKFAELASFTACQAS